MFDTVLFDLDGTLTDSGLGITSAAMYGLEKMGWDVPDRKEMYKFIGPPLFDTYQENYGMTPEQADEAVRYFREYYAVKGMLENEVYAGIREALSALKKAGKRLVLATSKPEQFAKQIMAHFKLDELIPEIAGATMDPSRSQKWQVIEYCLKEFSIDSSTAIMVGDRKHDVEGAARNGLPCLGVTYGFGSRDELETAEAIEVVDTPEEMAEFLLRR